MSVLEQARALAREALSTERGIDPSYPLSVCDRAIALLDPLGPNEMLADVLRWKGTILRDCGDHARALDYYAQSLATADAVFYTLGRAHALNCFGTIAQCRGDMNGAIAWYKSAQQLAAGLNERKLLAMVEQNLGVAAATLGRTEEAVQHLETALAQFDAEGDETTVLWVLNNLGNLYTRVGDHQRANDALQRAIVLAQKYGDAASEGIVEENRARLFFAMGKIEEAQDAATRALGIAAQRRDGTRQAAALYTLARIMRHRAPHSPEVSILLDSAMKLAQHGSDAELKGEIMREMAQSLEVSGDADRATAYRKAADHTIGTGQMKTDELRA